MKLTEEQHKMLWNWIVKEEDRSGSFQENMDGKMALFSVAKALFELPIDWTPSENGKMHRIESTTLVTSGQLVKGEFLSGR